MPNAYFPDPRQTGPDGIVAVGGQLTTDTLLLAYAQGIFPWPMPPLFPLVWFCPEERAVLEFCDLHVSRSLAKAQKKLPYEITMDKAFEQVIKICSKTPRPNQDGTWITPAIISAYCKLHSLGHAHSVEVWDQGQLIGGLYGVEIKGAFAGESMFYRKPNASKLALLYLIETLERRGGTWLDIQAMTPHMEALGAKLIPRDEFLKKLAETHSRSLKLFP